jgi:hypothetical protein
LVFQIYPGDDGYTDSSGAGLNTTDAFFRLGRYLVLDWLYERAFFRFPGVTVPRDATVLRAHLRVRITGGPAGSQFTGPVPVHASDTPASASAALAALSPPQSRSSRSRA